MSHKEELSEKYGQFYEKNGYLVVPDFVSLEQIEQLKKRMNERVNSFLEDPEATKKVSIFSTKQQTKLADEYFVQSGNKIRFFFEENAFDKDGKLVVDKDRAINKVGHALHELDETFKQFTMQERVRLLVQQIGMKDPLVVQSMYIFKQPGIGGYVSLHQDSTFMNTKPLSCHALWFALEDATVENGCLWVAPGSHKEGLTKRFKRNLEGTATFMTTAEHDEAATWKSLDDNWNKKSFPEKWVPLECKKGSVVALHGSVVHMSEANTSAQSRHAYTFHLVERSCKYSIDNWLQRPLEMPFKGFKE